MVALHTLTAVETARQDVKKSRFVAVAGPVSSEAEAKDFISAHADASANHNCWAWRIGQAYRFNDDGEPSGTAGKPILQAIDGQALDGVAVVVTRWFGGILLGSGGLIRAYGGTAAQCLREAATVPLIDKTGVVIACGFTDLALVQARLAALPAVEMTEQTFTADGATLSLSIHTDALTEVDRLITDITSGRVRIPTEKP
jgi:uncharacterized YigZ family protein